MATPNPRTLRLNHLPEIIIPDRDLKTKLKAQIGFMRKTVVLFHSLYLYHDKVKINELME